MNNARYEENPESKQKQRAEGMHQLAIFQTGNVCKHQRNTKQYKKPRQLDVKRRAIILWTGGKRMFLGKCVDENMLVFVRA